MRIFTVVVFVTMAMTGATARTAAAQDRVNTGENTAGSDGATSDSGSGQAGLAPEPPMLT